MSAYIAFIHPPEDGSEWGATFPDVPGCVSGGASFEAAVDAAGEALSGHLAAMLADGDGLPVPRTWTEIEADPECAADRDAAIIQRVFPQRARTGRIHVDIVIDEGVLRHTDAAARARGLTRSAFIEALLSSAAGD